MARANRRRRQISAARRAARLGIEPDRLRHAERSAAMTGVTVERALHGEVVLCPKQIEDANGQIAAPPIAIDTLSCMERNGTITAGMRFAGKRFHEDFVAAGFVALRAADLLRIAHVHGAAPPGPGGSLDAKDRLWRALQRVGGLRSAAARVLWEVVGREESLKEWATRSGWSGRPIHQLTAAGILIGALGAIEPYYEGA